MKSTCLYFYFPYHYIFVNKYVTLLYFITKYKDRVLCKSQLLKQRHMNAVGQIIMYSLYGLKKKLN